MSPKNYSSIFSYILPGRQNYWIWAQALLMMTGILFWGWSPFYVVMAYFFETIIIGLIHVAKMLTVLSRGSTQKMAVLENKHDTMNHGGAILFFLFHYFFFVAIQSIFVFAMFQKFLPAGNEAFGLIGNYKWLFTQPEFILVFSILAVSHLGIVVRDWFIPEKYHTYTLKKMFIQPYIRILVQQFVVILSGFFFILSSEGYAAALLVTGFRLLTDTLLIGVKLNEPLKEKFITYMLKNDGVQEKEVREQLEAMLDA
ncbi:MAG: DUF6498-containing protein [Chitinophagaceae bacterium]|jgi:hypothetical protein|nr:DUF6498-containing protein [Chitinophagaceae bacterium]